MLILINIRITITINHHSGFAKCRCIGKILFAFSLRKTNSYYHIFLCPCLGLLIPLIFATISPCKHIRQHIYRDSLNSSFHSICLLLFSIKLTTARNTLYTSTLDHTKSRQYASSSSVSRKILLVSSSRKTE